MGTLYREEHTVSHDVRHYEHIHMTVISPHRTGVAGSESLIVSSWLRMPLNSTNYTVVVMHAQLTN